MKTGVPRRPGAIDDDILHGVRSAVRRWAGALAGWRNDRIVGRSAAEANAEGGSDRGAPSAATDRRTHRICSMDENSRAVLSGIHTRLAELAESADAKAAKKLGAEERKPKDAEAVAGDRLHDTDNADETARSTVEGLGVGRGKASEPPGADPSDLDAIKADLEVILAAAMDAAPGADLGTPACLGPDPEDARDVDRLKAVEDEIVAISRALETGFDAVDARLTDLLDRAAPEEAERDRLRLAETEVRIAELTRRLDSASQPAGIDATVNELKEELLRAFKQDLDGLRCFAGEADQRIQDGLSSVRSTLAEIVERLERLENDRGRVASVEPLRATGTYGVAGAVPESGPRLHAVDPATPRGPGPYADRWNGPVRADLAALRELAMSAGHGLRETRTGRRADFIAAARRATKDATEEETSSPSAQPTGDEKPGAFARVSDAIRNRRRTLLATATGMIIAASVVHAVIPAKVAEPPDQPESTSPGRAEPAASAPLDNEAREPPATATPHPDPATFAFADPEKLDGRFGETAPSPPTHAFVRHRAAALPIDEAVGTIELRRAAAAGNPMAAAEVAGRYAEGRLVPRDLAKAAQWYELAAEEDNAVAQYRIASLYQRGQGVAKDLEAAAGWYRRAAEQGNAGAMHNLGVMMSEGIDGTADHGSAVKWFRAAADHGVEDSQYNLGVVYARGLGVGRNLVESYKWFALAANNGDPEAAARRDEIDNALSADERAKAYAAADAWWQKPAAPEANEVAALPDAWAEPPAGLTETNRRSLVTKIQTLLAEHGYDPGPADGLEGPKTRRAVRAFQRNFGLAETGAISSDVVAALADPAG